MKWKAGVPNTEKAVKMKRNREKGCTGSAVVMLANDAKGEVSSQSTQRPLSGATP